MTRDARGADPSLGEGGSGAAPGRRRRAPWWAYLFPIVALNYLRQALVDVGDALGIALFLGVTAAVAAVVTLGYRLFLPTDGEERQHSR
ncbi:MAG: hypothetical protein JST08_20330 [Actinobacteria bacterium]|nr:hypothetical protein [Actinomycetota bacterium]